MEDKDWVHIVLDMLDDNWDVSVDEIKGELLEKHNMRISHNDVLSVKGHYRSLNMERSHD